MTYSIKPVVYEFKHELGTFDIIFSAKEGKWYTLNMNGSYLNLKYLRLGVFLSNDYFSDSVEDICKQICVYLNREAINNSINNE